MARRSRRRSRASILASCRGRGIAERWRGSDVQRVDGSGATFSGTVAFERAIPFRAIGALGRQKSSHHLCSFLGRGIELGYLLTRIEEEARNDKSPGVDHDEITRRLSMRRMRMRVGCLASKALTHL